VRGALDRLGRSPAALVERNPVQIELERLLVFDELRDVVLVQQDLPGIRDAALSIDLRPGEDDRLSIGAPGRVALDVLGVVGARQRRVGTGLGVVDNEDALDRKEELGELDPGCRHEHRAVLDRADHVAAVGRHLGEEPEGELAVVPLVVAPGDDRFVVQRHLLGDGEDGVASLVVSVVDVEAQDAAIAREGVAVSADRQVLEDDGRSGFGVDRPEAPANARRVLDGVDEWERDLAIEDRIAHRVAGCTDADAGGRGRFRSGVDADDGHLHIARLASPLDLDPVLLRGAPARLRRRETAYLVAGFELEQDLPPRHALGLVVPCEGGGHDLGRKQCFVEGVGDLDAARRLARKRQRLGLAPTSGEHQRCDEQEARPRRDCRRASTSSGSSSLSRIHCFGNLSRQKVRGPTVGWASRPVAPRADNDCG
jgi:hypothetical protein